MYRNPFEFHFLLGCRKPQENVTPNLTRKSQTIYKSMNFKPIRELRMSQVTRRTDFQRVTGSLRQDGTNGFALREHVGGVREFVPPPPFPKRKIGGGAGVTEEGRGPFTHLVAHTYKRRLEDRHTTHLLREEVLSNKAIGGDKKQKLRSTASGERIKVNSCGRGSPVQVPPDLNTA